MTALAAQLRRHALAHRRVLIALGVLLLAGAGLRLWLMLSYRPGFVGYQDTGVYINGARGPLFLDRHRVVGYSAFLRWVHGVSADLSFTILVQHALGIASGLLLYASVVRAGVSRWAALVPLAVVLLCGGQVFVEHAVLSESVYTFLLASGVYCAVRALDGRALAWTLAAAALLSLSFTVRLAGIAVVPVLAVWVAWAGDATVRWRLARAGAALLAAVLVAVGYTSIREERTGLSGFTTTGAFTLYGHVATFADCSEFDPPEGSEFLCEERRPASERPGASFYIFDPGSPAVRHVGEPQLSLPRRGPLAALRRWTRAAILGQPVDYAASVARELVRYVDPSAHTSRGSTGLTPQQLQEQYLSPEWIGHVTPNVSSYYDTQGFLVREGMLDAARDYERATRLQGPVLVILVLLAAAAPFVTEGRARRVSVLLAGVALVVMLVPAATVFYDYRYALPAAGPLAATAALGGQGLLARVRR